MNGVGPAPEVNSNLTDFPFVHFIAIECAVHIFPHSPGHHGSGRGEKDRKDEECEEQHAPPAAALSPRRRSSFCLLGMVLMFHFSHMPNPCCASAFSSKMNVRGNL